MPSPSPFTERNVRMLFMDYSSAFNKIIPDILSKRLDHLHMPPGPGSKISSPTGNNQLDSAPPSQLLLVFYCSSVESVLSYWLGVVVGRVTSDNRRAVQRVINTAQKIIGCHLWRPSLDPPVSGKSGHITPDSQTAS